MFSSLPSEKKRMEDADRPSFLTSISSPDIVRSFMNESDDETFFSKTRDYRLVTWKTSARDGDRPRTSKLPHIEIELQNAGERAMRGLIDTD